MPTVATCLALALAVAGAPVADDAPQRGATGGRRVDPAAPNEVAWPADREATDAAPAGTTPNDDTPSDDETLGDRVEAASDDELDVPGYDPVRDSPEGLAAQRRISGGIALTVIGTAMTIGAIGLAASDACRPLAGNNCQVGARNRAAWVMGAPGVAILAGGITLLTLGLLKRQRILAGVTASRSSGGVVLSGRF